METAHGTQAPEAARHDGMLEYVHERIVALAAAMPDAPALQSPDRSCGTFRDLAAQVAYTHRRLSEFGVEPNHVVAGIAGSRVDMAAASLTVPGAATFTPLNPAWSADRYRTLLDRVQPRAVIVPRGADHALEHAAHARGTTIIYIGAAPDAPAGRFELEIGANGNAPATVLRRERPAALLLITSGTTGGAKIVPCAHRQVFLRLQVMARALHHNPADVACHVLPMYLSHGIRGGLMDIVLAGGSVVCLPQGDVGAVLDSVERFGATVLTAGVAVYRDILARGAEARARFANSKLRMARVGSGSLDAATLQRLELMLGAPALTSYSSTETCVMTQDPLPPDPDRRGSAGRVVEGDLKVLTPAGAFAAPGESGEILFRSDRMFDGYFDDDALTAQSFFGLWFRTGDLGHIDDDGYVHVEGRLKEIINRGGEKISPREIDELLQSLPGVAEAAAFGVPHPTLGEELVAAVVPSDAIPLRESDVLAALRSRLGGTRAPRRIYFLPRLPRAETGKLLRRDLAGLIDHASVGAVQTAQPLTPIEHDLVGIWQRFVPTVNLGVHDDFFVAGGDSLSGARLLAQVQAQFGVVLPLKALFTEAATIAGMAQAIAARAADATSAGASAPQRGPIRPRNASAPPAGIPRPSGSRTRS